jgi:hypothetical protein
MRDRTGRASRGAETLPPKSSLAPVRELPPSHTDTYHFTRDSSHARHAATIRSRCGISLTQSLHRSIDPCIFDRPFVSLSLGQ